jgi:hypothetical protein
MPWEPLGAVVPRELVPARLVLHWAAQLVAAAGAALVPPRADDSHTTFTWEAERRAFIGEPIPGRPFPGQPLAGQPFGAQAVALRVPDLTLVVGPHELPLPGATRADALAWLGKALEQAEPLPPYPHLPPPHPVGGDAPFPAADAGLAELSRWYGNAASLLGPIAAAHPEAGPVRVWPHHFDIATLLDLGAGRTVGVGLSPGDSSYAEPYFYVTPWPAPPDSKDRTGPPLTVGHWHTEGWFGAVLTATDGGTEPERAEGFLEGAIAAARELATKR